MANDLTTPKNIEQQAAKIVNVETAGSVQTNNTFYFTSDNVKLQTYVDGLPAGLSSYLSRLHDKYDHIPTLLYKEALSPFRSYYVPNSVEWRASIQDASYDFHYETIKNTSITNLLEIGKSFILSGTGGLGKSMMMRNFLLQCIDEYDSINLIPFFIPLKDFDFEAASFLDFVFDTVSGLWPELTKDGLDNLLSSGQSVLLFDGLDEITGSKLMYFLKKFHSFKDRYSSNHYIISSRPYSNFLSFSGFIVLQLQPFSLQQAVELIDRYNYRSDSPQLQSRFRSQFINELYRTHRGFSDNPLLLSIMLLTFEMDAEIPTTKYLFYQEAYTVLSRRHDANRNSLYAHMGVYANTFLLKYKDLV